jgi:hypothetical protein
MTDEDQGAQAKASEEIDESTVDEVLGPILDELERTAQHLTNPRSLGGRPEAAGRPPGRRPREAATGAVDFGLRMVERAALIPRRVVSGLTGMEFGGGPPPPPPAPAAETAQAAPQQGHAGSGGAPDPGSVARPPSRSVRSPLGARPETVTGSHTPTMRGIPGRRARHMVTVYNQSTTAVTARFNSTDLHSKAGGSIPASSVAFDPPSVTLRPRSRADVAITVHVPFGQSPGRYSGLVQAGQRVQTVIDLEVG